MVPLFHGDHPRVAPRMRFRGCCHLFVLVALWPRVATASRTIEKATCNARVATEAARNFTRQRVLLQVHSEAQNMPVWRHVKALPSEDLQHLMNLTKISHGPHPKVVTGAAKSVSRGSQRQHHSSSLLQWLFSRTLARGNISNWKEMSQDDHLILIVPLCMGIVMAMVCFIVIGKVLGAKGAEESDPLCPAGRTSPSYTPRSGELWDNHMPDDQSTPAASAQVSSHKQSPAVRGRTDRQPGSFGSPVSSKNFSPIATSLSPQIRVNGLPVSPESPSHVRHLCPGLVVPENTECLLAVPTLASIGVPPLDFAAFDVRDLGGRAVIHAEVVAPNVQRASTVHAHNSGANVGQRPMAVLRAAGSGTAGALMCYCKTARETVSPKTVYMYDSRDEFFAQISKDQFRDCYILAGGKGLNLIFEGSFRQHCVQVKNEHGELMADTENALMDFDPVGNFYRIRVVSGADVGLMLCGMLAIEHMEAKA